MNRFMAQGFPAKPGSYETGFVSISPNFSLSDMRGVGDTCHVTVNYMMMASDARELSVLLLRAADLADGNPIADMARTLTADSLTVDGEKVKL